MDNIEDKIADTANELHRLERSVQSRYLDEHGREIPDPTPMQPPIGYKKPISIADQMRQMIQQASYEAGMLGAETEEEANDFDVDEDFEPSSPWENEFEINPVYEAMLARASAPPVQGNSSAPKDPATPPASEPASSAAPPAAVAPK